MSRDDDEGFYEELSQLNNELVNLQRKLSKKNAQLQAALDRVRSLEGILTICMHCHKIRDPDATWQRLEQYMSEHSDVNFSHGVCPECLEKHYPEDDP